MSLGKGWRRGGKNHLTVRTARLRKRGEREPTSVDIWRDRLMNNLRAPQSWPRTLAEQQEGLARVEEPRELSEPAKRTPTDCQP